jgi:hypothetical protein
MARRTNKENEQLKQLGYTNGYAGAELSINLKQQTYFGLGDPEEGMKFWLSPENWCDVVPEGLTEKEITSIETAIKAGELVLGKKWIPVVDKEPLVLEGYVNLLDENHTITEEFRETIRDLFRHKVKGNYTALEIFDAMIEHEKKKRRRQPFIVFLQAAIDNYAGPAQLVQDYPTDPDNYSVTIDPVSKQVVSSNNKNSSSSKLDFKGLDDPSIRNSKIEEALG